jgi:hypothetical protein
MKPKFQSEYDYDGFYERAALLRPQFGLWDAYDLVAIALLDLVEAQNEIADCFDDDAHCLGNEAAFKAASQKRYAAGKKLMEALEDRDDWLAKLGCER